MRIERASAQTMAEEMAARWWGKKDLGEARLRPYTVESCPLVPLAVLASSRSEADHVGREGAGGLGSRVVGRAAARSREARWEKRKRSARPAADACRMRP